MKYHVLPTPKNLTSDDKTNKVLKGVFNDARQDLEKSLLKLGKKEKGGNSKDIFYLYDIESMKKLMKLVKEGDEIVLHGEGQPFLIGLGEPSIYDLTPFKLAKLLAKHNLPDININISLLACYSATQYQELNFAQNTSQALYNVFHYKNPMVTGYTGMVKVNSNAKYSVTSEIEKDKKGTHANLQDASLGYKSGQLIKNGRVLADNSHIAYSWATHYIERARKENNIVTFLKTSTTPHSIKTPLTRSESFNLNIPKESDEKDTKQKLRRTNSFTFFVQPLQEKEETLVHDESLRKALVS